MIAQACVIGVVRYGDEKILTGLQWAYDSEQECLILILYGKDMHIPIDHIALTNVIPKEFVLKVTKNKRKIRKPRHTHIVEKKYAERNETLIEIAQTIFDSKKKTWTKNELIKFFQDAEI